MPASVAPGFSPACRPQGRRYTKNMHKHSRPRKFLAEFPAHLPSCSWPRVRAAFLRSTPLGIAVAYGVAYGAAVAALGHISGGHFNPAVTVAHWVTHRFGTFDALLYIARAACRRERSGLRAALCLACDHHGEHRAARSAGPRRGRDARTGTAHRSGE